MAPLVARKLTEKGPKWPVVGPTLASALCFLTKLEAASNEHQTLPNAPETITTHQKAIALYWFPSIHPQTQPILYKNLETLGLIL